MDVWVDGWVVGWMGVEVILRIAYINQKYKYKMHAEINILE